MLRSIRPYINPQYSIIYIHPKTAQREPLRYIHIMLHWTESVRVDNFILHSSRVFVGARTHKQKNTCAAALKPDRPDFSCVSCGRGLCLCLSSSSSSSSFRSYRLAGASVHIFGRNIMHAYDMMYDYNVKLTDQTKRRKS